MREDDNKELAKLVMVVVNAAAMVAVVILQDPGLRQDFQAWWRKVTTPTWVYHPRKPTPGEVRAVLDRATEIAREGAIARGTDDQRG